MGDGPAAVTAGGGAVWVANVQDRRLLRLDPRTRQVVGGEVGKELDGKLLTRDGVWVAGAAATVTRLDPRTGRQVGTAIPVGGSPLSLAPAPGGIWVGSVGDRSVQLVRGRSVVSAAQP